MVPGTCCEFFIIAMTQGRLKIADRVLQILTPFGVFGGMAKRKDRWHHHKIRKKRARRNK
jgi:hypothetical protein